MPAPSTQFDIGSLSKANIGIDPVASTGATHNGTGIDRQGFLSGYFTVQAGAATGTPTGQTVDATLQHSATVGGTYVNIAGAAIVQMTADSQVQKIDVNLRGVNQFVRVQVVTTLTGGTSPTIPVSAAIHLGGADRLPA